MIRTRLIIGFVLLALLSTVQSIVFLRFTNDATTELERIAENSAPIIITTEQILADAQKMLGEAVSVALLIEISDDPVDLDIEAARSGVVEAEEGDEDEEEEGEEESIEEEIEEEFVEFVESYQRIVANVAVYEGLLTPENENRSEQLLTEADAILQTGLDLIVAALEGDADEIAEGKEDMENVENALEETTLEIVLTEQDRLNALSVAAGQRQQTTNNLALTITGGLFAVAVIIAIFTARGIIQPIQRLQSVADAVAKGDFKNRLEADGRAEVLSLQLAFNNMLDAIQERDTQLEQRVVEANDARAEAERASQVRSTFLASMSHELRTPLNAIINFTKFVAEGDLGPVNTEQKETLAESVDSGQYLLSLINDVLDMSKIDSGSLQLFVEEEVSIAEIIQATATTAKSLLDDKPVEVRTDVPETLPTVRGDKQRIRQIVLNIVSNATKFTEKGHIDIRATHTDKDVTITVSDTGVGIPAADFAAVFEPFEQTRSGLRSGEGTGLGMPIAKNIAEMHGGQIRMESTEGQGTTFYITLPIQSDTLTVHEDA